MAASNLSPAALRFYQQQQELVAITASFTAEPVERALAFWLGELGISAEIRFSPFNQVFQQLLDKTSLLSGNARGLNVVLVRLQDWLDAPSDGEIPAPTAEEKIRRLAQDLVSAVKTAAQGARVPHLVCFCPGLPQHAENSDVQRLVQEIEDRAVFELTGISGVHSVTSSSLLATYPVTSWYDPYTDGLGHIPYTPACFAALGTWIARRMFAMRMAPYKVIALDCDQTLWRGVCAEDGTAGIVVDPPRRALQQFLVGQYQAGMLLALVSKNEQRDVWNVFEQHPDMILRREQITGWRINWNPKSQDLVELAQELGLGLDSFIFIDDNPVECAEVHSNCPEVLTLLLPAPVEQLPRFLEHVWAFDHIQVTEEDRQRTNQYRENIQREHLRRTAMTFREFLVGLDLQVEISEMRPGQLARVAQLTRRTNQFNTTTVGRNESEIQQLVQAGTHQCLVTLVRDRFGDYGLVGAVLLEWRKDAIYVDSCMLSCRALGRGVEHQMIARLGEIAKQHGLARVDIAFRPTTRNQPAFNFLEQVAGEFKQAADAGTIYRLPAAFASGVRLDALSAESQTAPEPVNSTAASAAAITLPNNGPARSDLINQIATDLNDAELILKRIQSQMRRTRPVAAGAYRAPHSATELALANIFCQVLFLDQVGVTDNFFDLGGNSLQATQLISRLRDVFQVELPLRWIFEVSTIAGMARYIETVHWALLAARTARTAQEAATGDGEAHREFGEL